MSLIDLDKLKSILQYDSQAPLIFNSGLFLWLFLAFLGVYILLRKQHTARIMFVTLFSYYFYYKSSGFYFFLLALVTCVDFSLARLMNRVDRPSDRKFLVGLSLGVNLGLLAYFKYTNFLASSFANLLDLSFQPWDIFLPVGISFFTFQSLSYTIDVYRGKIKPLTNLLDYAFYVSFFPQLVAGPIVRAKDFIPQIRKPLLVTDAMFNRGLYLILSGLIKKAVISDYISVNFVERIFANPSLYSGVENLMGVYGYALQIYCDFSGYSDMAIGLALLLGFHFPINFDSPYQSSSITEFWRRWHISLSGWLKDYLYISLGGNRKGKVRQYANLFITMFLGGLWHGASWNFIVWGCLHGVALILHKLWMGLTKGIKKNRVGQLLGIVITFHFVCFSWIFFRNTSFDHSMVMLEQIINVFKPELLIQLLVGYKEVFFLILLGYIAHALPRKVEAYLIKGISWLPFLGKVFLIVSVIYLVIQVKSSSIQPFIYFQF